MVWEKVSVFFNIKVCKYYANNVLVGNVDPNVLN